MCIVKNGISTLLILMFPSILLAQDSKSSSFPLQITSVDVVGKEARLGRPIHNKLASDGSVYVADWVNNEVLRISPAGEILWRAGREGEGPGEFRMLYRIAGDLQGRLFAFDVGTGRISEFDQAGNFIRRHALPVSFSRIDGFVALDNGGFALSGVTARQTSMADYGVHLFDSEFNYIESFGPLPAVEDPVILSQWGAGGLETALNGDLLYTRKIPYEIYRYSTEGELLSVIEAPFENLGRPEDMFTITRSGGRTAFGIAKDHGVAIPLPAEDLGSGWLLGGRNLEGDLIWDLFSPSGELVGSRRIPDNWGGVIGFDPDRQVLWMTGTDALEPVLLRLKVDFSALSSEEEP